MAQLEPGRGGAERVERVVARIRVLVTGAEEMDLAKSAGGRAFIKR